MVIEMIRVFLADLTCIFEEENYHKAFSVSSPQRQRKAEKFRNLPDQARCIGAGLLLEQSVWLYQNHKMQIGLSNSHKAPEQMNEVRESMNKVPKHMNSEELQNSIYIELQSFLDTLCEKERSRQERKNAYLSLQYEENGRPFLEGEGRDDIPYLSISHSGYYAAVALSDQRVGIDIEHSRKISGAVAKKILTQDEYKEYETICSKSEDAAEYLLEKWTQKEAVAKLDGSGVFTLLPSLSDGDWLQAKEIEINSIKPAEGYFLSVAYQKSLYFRDGLC
ncbi:MAG: 4'-phosphopantetheinyl transferase superfamily protein [Lachnospiraceae bacterium]|nr:4'-phosphopantetheinyl transferase superfamily protein [Lachnospiraceae bacterium]